MATAKDTVKKEPQTAASAPAAAEAHHAPAPSHGHKAARYTEAVGRRKTAIARVRISAGKGTVTVNGKDVKSYFSTARLVAAAKAPLNELKLTDLDVSVRIVGGGIRAQAEAIRLGLARAIVLRDGEWKPRLRAVGYMTRDSRMVERKKYGKKKARRSPQWAKR
ncbi:MAG TPA: 30S ribosomal protein S9 [Candidatus Paceibacterota bacterium]|nr:30S ribosomal protein S9 [Candidatus Paceibacterota bacterium]